MSSYMNNMISYLDSIIIIKPPFVSAYLVLKCVQERVEGTMSPAVFGSDRRPVLGTHLGNGSETGDNTSLFV